MKNIFQAKQQPNIILKKPIWKSEFVDESSDDESIYFSKNFEIFLELR